MIVSMDSSLKSFITHLERNKNKSYSLQDWNRLCREQKWSDEQWKSWSDLKNGHNEEGRHLRELDRFKDAAQEWERALVLSPREKELRFELAQLYRSIYENQSHNPVHRQKAQYHLKRLEKQQQTDNRSKVLAKDLLNLQKVLEPVNKDRRALLVLLIPLLLSILMVIISQRDYLIDQVKGYWDRRNQPLVNDQDTAPPPLGYGTRPVRDFGFQEENIHLSIEQSEVLDWNGHDAYRLQAKIEHEDQGIEDLQVELVLVGPENQELYSGLLDLPGPEQGTIAAGDTIILDHFQYLGHRIDQLERVNLNLLQWRVLSRIPPRSVDSPLRWDGLSPPQGVRLELLWGEVQELEGYDRQYYRREIQLKNNGNAEITALDIRAELRGTMGQVLDQQSLTLVSSIDQGYHSGESRSYSLQMSMNYQDLKLPQSWELFVTSIRTE